MSPPHAPSTLTHPDTRSELLAYVRAATNPEFWRDVTEVGFLVHFIFDDHDFRPGDGEIGRTLLNDNEAAALTTFVDCLDAAIGPRSKPLSALKASDWSPVASAAAYLEAVFAQADRSPG